VVTGNREAVSELIHSDFDYIFFTGSVPVGKIVMEAASKNLTPVTLELGGKSPTIVHKDADIEKAAARIAWGKYYNAGQTCIAPDYIYVHEDVKDRLLEGLIKEIVDFYGVEPLKSPDYGRIINHKEFNRLSDLIDDQKLYFGGEKIEEKLKISPTILTNVTWDDDVMQEEIFGPILPVLTYNKISEVVNIIKDKPRPLSLYLFTEDKNLQKKIEDEVPFGGGCINDTISHVSSPRLPFGGTGNSGIGSYHGEESFITFSHKKSMMKKSTKFDIRYIYPPYKGKLGFIKKIMK
jgi:aldehyde dehydrogenase (NAD+)